MAAEGVNVKRKNGVQAAHGTAHLCILVILVVLVAWDEHFNTGKTTTKHKLRPTKPWGGWGRASLPRTRCSTLSRSSWHSKHYQIKHCISIFCHKNLGFGCSTTLIRPGSSVSLISSKTTKPQGEKTRLKKTSSSPSCAWSSPPLQERVRKSSFASSNCLLSCQPILADLD